MISATAEYALRAVVYLAQYEGEPKTTSEIAEATRVPSGYLSKIMQSLVKRDLVSSQRGLGGGFVLARKPLKISVYDVLAAVDQPPSRIEKCPLGLKGHVKLCAVHKLLDDAMAQIEKGFRASSIGELLKESTNSKPLCEMPATTAKLAASKS